MRLVSSVGLIVAYLVYAASSAFASNAELHDAVHPQLVVIESRGTFAESGDSVQSSRMGFTVSEDGLVLTTYSLLTSLGNVKPESITIKAGRGDGPTRPSATLPAVIYSEDPRHNLLLLHVKGLKRDNHLDLGDSTPSDGGIPSDGGMLLTSGYDNSGQYKTHQGYALAEDGLSSLWETDLDVDESEIGAPVYSSGSRKIIGIARGKIWPSLKNYVIPIELAEPLLLTLRIKEIDTGDAAKIRDIESKIKVLQRQFNWFTRPDDSQSAKAPLRLCYEKFISGDPKPTSARISIRQSYIAGEKRESLPTQPERQQPIIIPALAPPSGPDGDCEGYFDLSDVVESAGDVKKMYSADKVDIQVDIIVTLSDGSTLPSKRIIVDGSTLPAKRVNFER